MDRLTELNEIKDELSCIHSIDDKPKLDALLPKIKVYLDTIKLKNKFKDFNDISFVPREIEVNKQTNLMKSLAFKNGVMELKGLFESV